MKNCIRLICAVIVFLVLTSPARGFDRHDQYRKHASDPEALLIDTNGIPIDRSDIHVHTCRSSRRHNLRACSSRHRIYRKPGVHNRYWCVPEEVTVWVEPLPDCPPRPNWVLWTAGLLLMAASDGPVPAPVYVPPVPVYTPPPIFVPTVPVYSPPPIFIPKPVFCPSPRPFHGHKTHGGGHFRPPSYGSSHSPHGRGHR